MRFDHAGKRVQMLLHIGLGARKSIAFLKTQSLPHTIFRDLVEAEKIDDADGRQSGGLCGYTRGWRRGRLRAGERSQKEERKDEPQNHETRGVSVGLRRILMLRLFFRQRTNE